METRKLKPMALVQGAREVVKTTRYTWSEVTGPSRVNAIVRVRQALFFVMHNDHGLSMSWIGRIFGNRDHTTVLHGVNRARQCVGTQNDIDEMIAIYRAALDGREISETHVYVETVTPKYVKAVKAEREAKTPDHKRHEIALLAALKRAHPERETSAYRRAA